MHSISHSVVPPVLSSVRALGLLSIGSHARQVSSQAVLRQETASLLVLGTLLSSTTDSLDPNFKKVRPPWLLFLMQSVNHWRCRGHWWSQPPLQSCRKSKSSWASWVSFEMLCVLEASGWECRSQETSMAIVQSLHAVASLQITKHTMGLHPSSASVILPCFSLWALFSWLPTGLTKKESVMINHTSFFSLSCF